MTFIAGCIRPLGSVALGPNDHSTTIGEWTGCDLFTSLLDQAGETDGRTHGERVCRHQAQHNRA